MNYRVENGLLVRVTYEAFKESNSKLTTLTTNVRWIAQRCDNGRHEVAVEQRGTHSLFVSSNYREAVAFCKAKNDLWVPEKVLPVVKVAPVAPVAPVYTSKILEHKQAIQKMCYDNRVHKVPDPAIHETREQCKSRKRREHRAMRTAKTQGNARQRYNARHGVSQTQPQETT